MSTKAQLQSRWKEEPGKSIREQIMKFSDTLVIGHRQRPDALFSLLDKLPFREEVPGGRDFRGSDFMDGREFDLTNSDFSYAPDIGNFFDCDLAGAKFDESRGERSAFLGSNLCGASFRRVRYRSMSFATCDARGASFDEARLYHPRFDEANLAGASFRDTDLNGACFVGANLQGCDFRGAKLDRASLYGVVVDPSTDFRGASLINAAIKDRFDFSGNLLGRALDLKTVKIDATTRLGTDPKEEALEVLQAALEVSTDRRELEALRTRQAVQMVLLDLQQGYFQDWYDRVFAQLTPAEKEVCDEIMDDAFRSLL